MTDEQNNSASGDERDALVTKAYREVANEQAPSHLDKAVLDAAAKAARPRYSRLTAWTRPAAWAATIMLSVALVLELSQTPVIQAPEIEALAPEMDADLLQRAEDMARVREGENEQPAQPVPQPKERVASPDASFAISTKSELQSNVATADDSAPCDAQATAEPESWLACIVELEEAGLTDLAREQRTLLAEAFPDFRPR